MCIVQLKVLNDGKKEVVGIIHQTKRSLYAPLRAAFNSYYKLLILMDSGEKVRDLVFYLAVQKLNIA